MINKIIYNISFILDPAFAGDFLHWFENEAMPILLDNINPASDNINFGSYNINPGADINSGTDNIKPRADIIKAGLRPRLLRVVDVPGDPDFASQASNFSFQMPFETPEQCRKWGEDVLSRIAEAFANRFGRERALTFSTILEEIPLPEISIKK